MPKDLTKLSHKELALASDGELEQRIKWENGSMVMTVSEAPYSDEDESADET